MSFILGALRQVLLQRAAEIRHREGRLFPLFLRMTLGLFALTLLPSLVLTIWAPRIYVWVFGAEWHMAGEFARSLIIWMAFAFCNLPAVLFAQVIRIQRTVLVYDVVVLLLRTSVLVLGGLLMSPAATVMLFAIFGAIANTSLIVVVGSVLYRREK